MTGGEYDCPKVVPKVTDMHISVHMSQFNKGLLVNMSSGCPWSESCRPRAPLVPEPKSLPHPVPPHLMPCLRGGVMGKS